MKSKRIMTLGVFLGMVLLLQGCTNLNPPTRYAPCANWGHNCHWHKANKGVDYPRLKLKKETSDAGVIDTNNANNGRLGYQW